ncbi:MAG: Arm DNA-binding domain-containing protein [Campylobacter sp.]|nr:Arm DNA-binding domain-containing protein [Campylobacter sp.]
MGNISKANLLDKDIKLLAPKTNRYLVAVGNPKELYIWVNPNGIKSFCVRVDENGKKKHIKIKEFREGIYSVAEARKDATKLLKELESGKDIATIKGKNDKYLFKNLFELYYAQKEKMELAQARSNI